MKRPIPAGVYDVLDAAVRNHPDSTALVTHSGRLTYAELDRRADLAAGALYQLGLRPGDRVAASLDNDAPIVEAFHGAMRLGAIWVGINQALAPPEKAFMLHDANVSVLLVEEGPGDALISAGVLDGSVRLVRPLEWGSAMAASAGRPDLSHPDPEAAAAIAYTSGTTGFPKGAVHCQAALVLPGAATVARRQWGPALRKGDSLPLTILNLQTLTTLLTSQAGGTEVLMYRSDVASVVETIRSEAVTIWNGPPAQMWTMVRDPSVTAADLASLEEVWAGGADCPDSLRDDFEARFGVRVCRTYGLTEAPALVSLDDLEGPLPDGTSGRALDHIDIDCDDGEIVLHPQTTGAWAGLYRPALGYWNQPEAAVGVIGGRTLRTGDLGRLDRSGHLKVLGRRSTVIIRGGANVYPAEVERVLVQAPGVAACAVVGVPDERLGERIGAAVEAQRGEEVDLAAVADYCRIHLAAYKVPERWVVLEQLPRNQMGKVPGPAVRALIQSGGTR